MVTLHKEDGKHVYFDGYARKGMHNELAVCVMLFCDWSFRKELYSYRMFIVSEYCPIQLNMYMEIHKCAYEGLHIEDVAYTSFYRGTTLYFDSYRVKIKDKFIQAVENIIEEFEDFIDPAEKEAFYKKVIEPAKQEKIVGV